MIVNSFQIDEALQLKPLSVEEISEARTAAEARIWIDLQGSEPSEFDDWLDKLEVRGLSRQLCLEARIEKTQPNVFSADETADVGVDDATQVADKVFNDVEDSEFTGRVNKVTISIPKTK